MARPGHGELSSLAKVMGATTQARPTITACGSAQVGCACGRLCLRWLFLLGSLSGALELLILGVIFCYAIFIEGHYFRC